MNEVSLSQFDRDLLAGLLAESHRTNELLSALLAVVTETAPDARTLTEAAALAGVLAGPTQVANEADAATVARRSARELLAQRAKEDADAARK